MFILKTSVINFDVQLSIKSIKNSLFRDDVGDLGVWGRQVVSEGKNVVKWKEWIKLFILCFNVVQSGQLILEVWVTVTCASCMASAPSVGVSVLCAPTKYEREGQGFYTHHSFVFW